MRDLGLLTGLFLLSRLLLLLFAVDAFSFFEEYHTGTAIRDLVQGLRMPFLEYQDMRHSGEVLVLAVVGSPFFLLLGDTLLAVKLSSLTIHLLMLGAAYLLLFRFAGRFAGFAGAGLLILAPPSIVRTALIPIYQHSEVLVFAFIAYLLLLSGPRGGLARHAALGLVSGLGLFYSYTFAAALAAMATLLAVRSELRPRRREALVFCGTFLLAMAPRLVQTLQPQGPPLRIGGRSVWYWFAGQSLAEITQRVAFLLGRYLPESFFFRSDSLDAAYLLALLAGSGVAAWWSVRRLAGAAEAGDLARRERAELGGLLLAHIGFYLLAVGLSGFDLERSPDGYRYVIPVHFVLILLAAVGLQELADIGSRWSRILGVVIAATLTLTGLVNYGQLLALGSTREWARALDYVGSSDKAFDWLSAIKVADSTFDRVDQVAPVREPHTYFFDEQLWPTLIAFGAPADAVLRAIEHGKKRRGLEYGGLGKLGSLALAERIPGELRGRFYENYGQGLVHLLEVEAPFFWRKTTPQYVSTLGAILDGHRREVPEDLWPAFVAGLGRGFNLSFTGRFSVYEALIESLGPAERMPFAIGLGRLAGWRYGPRIERRLQRFRTLSEPTRAALFVGLGWETSYDLWDGSRTPEELQATAAALPQAERTPFCRGLLAGARVVAWDDDSVLRTVEGLTACASPGDLVPAVSAAIRELETILAAAPETRTRPSSGEDAGKASGVEEDDRGVGAQLATGGEIEKRGEGLGRVRGVQQQALGAGQASEGGLALRRGHGIARPLIATLDKGKLRRVKLTG